MVRAVTLYPEIALPPSEVGAVQVTAALTLPGVASTDLGAPGTPAGVTGDEALDGDPAPAALLAVTVNVYESPLVRPETVHPIVPDVEQVSPP